MFASDYIYPHFTVFVNGSIGLDGFTGDQWNEYIFVCDTILMLNQITVSFNNDAFNEKEDRNLYIKTLQINDIIIPARSEYANYYDKNDILRTNPVSANFQSVADLCANSLISKGIPRSKLFSLTAFKIPR